MSAKVIGITWPIPRDVAEGIAEMQVMLGKAVRPTDYVEEFVIRFTHSLRMDWLLPGVPVTGRKVEFALVGVIGIEGGKVASEHLYWDQATVLSQLGVLDHPTAAAGVGSGARLLELSRQAVMA